MSLTGSAESKKLRGRIHMLKKLQGYSAYEVAVINGFSGTEEEWLASLNGDKGDPGVVDENGLVLKDQTTGEKYTLYVSDGKLTMAEREG